MKEVKGINPLMMSMTKKERVIQALQHQSTDFVPYHCDFTEQAMEKMITYTGNAHFLDTFDVHLNYIQYWGWPTEKIDQPEHFVDDFGVTWNRSGADKDIGVVDTPLIVDIENYQYTFPVIDEKRLRAEYETLCKNQNDQFKMAGFGFSMFERAWSLCGMENILTNMVSNPKETQELFENICAYNLKLIDIALEYDIDGVYFGDDWGQQHGLIMGPRYWRAYIKPQMAKMYEKVKSAGKFVVQHSCGDCHEIFGDLIDIGLDCYQTFQPEIYDMKAIKKEYGNDLSFWGGISTQQLLPFATPQQIREEVKKAIDIMSENGGYIVAPTHALTFDIPCENILAMIDAFKNQ